MRVTPKPAFLFDLDGTLADTLPDLAASTNHVRGLHGLGPVDLATVRTFIGDGARTLLQRALATAIADTPAGPDREALLDQAFASYVVHHREHLTVHSKLFPGVKEHLGELQSDGHPIAIVTNKPERFARPVAQHLGLDAFTEVLVGGDTLPTRKPDPAMLQFALDQLGCSDDGATMVGDGLQDLRSGKNLGLRTIACLFGYGNEAELRNEGADVFWGAFANPE